VNREIRNLLSLSKRMLIPDVHLFNRFVDVALGDTVEGVMTSIPPEFLPRFRDWIDGVVPSLDKLIHLKSGPLSEREKATIRAMRAWLDRHPPEDRTSADEAIPALNGLNAAGAVQPVGDPRLPTP